MADWDPFAMDGGDEVAAVDVNAPSAAAEEADLPTRMLDYHINDIMDQVDKHLMDRNDKPWCDYEAASKPDLSLYTPTCGIEDWKHKDVDLVIGKGIAYIVLNRPDENNSITDSVNAAFCDATHALHARPDIRVVVITGRGKMFCSGQDPRWDGVPTQPRSAEAIEAGDKLIAKAMKTGVVKDKEQIKMLPFMKPLFNFCQLPQITICVMNGSVNGQGIGYACACDVVIAPKSCYFSLTDVKMGIVPAAMAPFLCLKTSNTLAKKMMMLGETFDAAEAKTKGFVNFVVEDLAEAQKVLKEVCGRVAKMSPVAVHSAKRLSYGVAGYPVTEGVMWQSIKYLNESLNSTFKQSDTKPWENDPLEPIEPAPFSN